MRYLIDGYNITMADDATRRLPRGEQRLALVRRLASRRGELLGVGRATVVFDGAEDGSGEERVADIEVVFARGESADDVIVRLARSSAEGVTLVTSDRELQARVRAATTCDVVIRTASTLFDEHTGRRPKRRGGGSTAGLPKGANRITEELKKLWLPDDDRS